MIEKKEEVLKLVNEIEKIRAKMNMKDLEKLRDKLRAVLAEISKGIIDEVEAIERDINDGYISEDMVARLEEYAEIYAYLVRRYKVVDNFVAFAKCYDINEVKRVVRK